ncbi:MAG: FUSC family protein [Coriobacteriia bacterium]|nr:FUSC family protein [Coriobacteriia bacterium]
MKRNYKIIAVLTGAMLILLVGFPQLFGRENLIVGIIFTLALTILNRLDMPWHPLRYGSNIVGISLLIGLVTWFFDFSANLAVIITFAVVFIATYYLFGDFQATLYAPVVIGYLYLLSASNLDARIEYRFASLLLGALILIAAMTLINHLKKNQSLTGLLNELISEVAHHAIATAGSSEIEFVPTPIDDIVEHISEINRRLYRHPVRSREMSMIAEMRISLVLTLERLVIALEDLRTSHMPSLIERQALADLAALLEEIHLSSDELDELKSIEPQIEEFTSRYRADIDADDVDASPALYELISAFDVLSRQINTLRHLWAQDEVEKTEVGDMFWARELRKIVRPTSLRLIFALKNATTIAILVGIGYFVPWPQYSWLVFAAAFVMRPYAEDTEQRSITRIGGTFMGIIAFTLLFAITSNDPFLFAVGVGLQILSYLLKTNTYLQLSVSTTSVLTLVALASSETGLLLSIERLVFVSIGAIIAMLVTGFVYPYRVTIASVDLVERSRHLSHLMLKKVLRIRLDYEDSDEYARITRQATHNIKGTALAINIIEHQLMLNSQIRDYDQVHEFVRMQHRLVNDIYFFYAIFPQLPEKNDEIDEVMLRLEELIGEIDDELVREEGRHTHYGGPNFYERGEEFLSGLNRLLKRIDSTYAYVDDEDSRLALSALHDIVEKITVPFTFEWDVEHLK